MTGEIRKQSVPIGEQSPEWVEGQRSMSEMHSALAREAQPFLDSMLNELVAQYAPVEPLLWEGDQA